MEARMETVAELLAHKGNDTITISPESTVYDAIKLMSDRNIGAVLVVGPDNTMIGILTERDYARQIVLAGRSSKTTRVAEIMTTDVVYVKPSHTVEEAMAIMTDHRCRHLPVLDQGHLVGLISIGDVVRSMIHEKDFVIDQLKHYISGSV
jgi:CBS domain-containing protein